MYSIKYTLFQKRVLGTHCKMAERDTLMNRLCLFHEVTEKCMCNNECLRGPTHHSHSTNGEHLAAQTREPE